MDDSKRPETKADDIATLVRLADQATISGERMERVRAVARTEWREKTRRRTRNRMIGWIAASAAVLAMVAILGGVFNRSGQDPLIELALVEGLTGGVTQDSGAGATILTGDGSVPMNAVVETARGAGVALRLPAGHSLRIDGESEVELRTDGSVALLAGTLYLESDSRAPNSPIDVHTPFGTVQEIGTQFELRLQQRGLRIRLREGTVRLDRPDSDYIVEAGTEFNIDSAGKTETRSISTYGGEWDWVSTMTPVPDLRGRSTHTFLTWVVREKGWSLAFNDEDALRAAQAAIVEGRLDQLTPDEALGAVMQASRLEHRLTEGTLVVSGKP